MPEPLKRSHIKREAAQARAYSQAVITEGGRTIWLAGQVAIEDSSDRSLAARFRRPGPRGLRPARADARRGRREPCRFGDDDRVHHRCAARRPVHPAPPGDLRRQFPSERLDNRRRPGAPGNAGRGARCRGRKVSRPMSHRGRPLTTHLRPSCPRRRLVGSPRSGHSRQTFGHAGGPAHVSSSNSAFASFRSGVSKPSVNQL